MSYQTWSWVLGLLGLLGLYLAGKKVWWSWYINIFNQVLWLAYSLVSHQYGFLVATAGYTIVFVKNAYSWTREHREPRFKTNERIGEIQRVEEVLDNAGQIEGISIGFKLDSQKFVGGLKRSSDAVAVIGDGVKIERLVCYDQISYDGTNYSCAHVMEHPKEIPHWTRADISKDYRCEPIVADIFWDETGVTHVIEVRD